MADKLTVEEIDVPEGMLDAFMEQLLRGTGKAKDAYRESWRKELSAALLWLAENPIVPSMEDAKALTEYVRGPDTEQSYTQRCLAEWQRRMCLRKPDPVPEEVKALLHDPSCYEHVYADRAKERNAAVLKAYELGKAAR